MHKNSRLSIDNYRECKEYPRIVTAVAHILQRQRFVAPLELFVEMGLLLPADLKRWKQGQIPSLEIVIRCNLTRASRILHCSLLTHHFSLRALCGSISVFRSHENSLRKQLDRKPNGSAPPSAL